MAQASIHELESKKKMDDLRRTIDKKERILFDYRIKTNKIQDEIEKLEVLHQDRVKFYQEFEDQIITKNKYLEKINGLVSNSKLAGTYYLGMYDELNGKKVERILSRLEEIVLNIKKEIAARKQQISILNGSICFLEVVLEGLWTDYHSIS